MENGATIKIDNLFPNNLILCGYRGSFAQNTYIPNRDPDSIDDIDLMGVYLAPPEYYIGLGFTNRTDKRYNKSVERFIDCWDAVSYEMRKFVRLLLKSNPNVLSLLWIKDEHYFPIIPCPYKEFGKMLVDNRDIFVSKNAYEAFVGYAEEQMKKMTHFKKEGYMGEKRKNLVKKYGFDIKNAGHLIRLLKMGIEYLNDGKLNVFRTDDVDMLIDIKTGKWSLEKVKKEADILFDAAKDAYEKSPLPEKPDAEKAEELVMTIIKSYLKEVKNK